MKTAKELELSLLIKEAHIQQLKLKVNNLEKRINKAVEYIENPSHELSVKSYQNLLEILKGEDNE